MNQIGLETWRGGVRIGHIDEMGHMNVRHYVSIAMEALVGFAGALGMPRAFTGGASATLQVREHHIRFLKEARAGDPLHMCCAILEFGESHARVLQTLYHSQSGEPAASLTTLLEHVTPGELRAFPWPAQARRAAQALMAQAPEYSLPRSIEGGPVTPQASLERAKALGLPVAALGALAPADCDALGRMSPDHLFSRISSGVAHMAGHRRSFADQDQERLGGAVVEFRAIFLAWPKPGDGLCLRSGLKAFTPKSRRVSHWLLDPVSGRAWASAEWVAVFFDLKTRRTMELPSASLEALSAQVIPGLDF